MTVSLAPRATAHRTADELRALAESGNAELGSLTGHEASPAEIVRWVAENFATDAVAVACSMADAALPHLVAAQLPGVDVLFLDTGYHFAETIGTRDAVAAIHDVNLISLTPVQSVAEQDATWGKDLFARNPDQCCALRKTAPLDAALSGYTAWASGVRRADSAARANTPLVEWDLRRKIVKIFPIAAWSDDEVADYIEANSLLVNPLFEDGYTSIGCEPCTSRASADDPRAGRWAGLAKTECGIHR